MEELTVRAVAFETLEDLNTFGVFLGENQDGTGERLEVQRALEFDEQDHDLGMATDFLCVSHAASVLPVNVHAIDPDLPPFQMSRSCSTFSALGSSHLSEALLARATRALGQRRRSLPRRALRSRRSRLGISRLEPRGVHVERGVRLVSYGRLRSLHGQRGRRCSLRGGRRRG